MSHTTYESVAWENNLPVKILHFNLKEISKQYPQLDIQSTNFIPLHWHRSIEFTYVKKGNIFLRVNDNLTQINSGEYLLVNHNELHEIHSNVEADTEAICLIISYDYLKNSIPDFDTLYFKLNPEHSSYKNFKQRFEKIVNYYNDHNEYNYLRITSIINEIMFDLINYHSSKIKHENVREQAYIKEVINYIHSHYNEDLTLETMSSEFHISREHFSRLFKARLNTSFLNYLQNYRIYQAFPEIVNSNLTIDAISRKHGFPNTKSLIAQFKKRYNATPMEYRKKHHQEISIIDHNLNIE
ncbi:AraC family transcriptional regulator [Breznakia pachnodae]|uniref:AraC-like DNA-binding protein n=1 Tax=Breznakia pachnodae TaxID=265178 RepID=A0ABU0E522_9FIRM|nr:AraC family transcriptional regulator [Breznakia pachnodae]MDQ0361821.1 AraC-like DNA-binding protein [Breznakia pachnodae]